VAEARTIAALAVWAIVVGGVGLGSGCYGHNCDGDVQVYGRNPNEGELVNADTWESSPIDGDWIPFTKQRLWIFVMRDLGDRTPYKIDTFISAEKNPHAANGNWTLGSGNLSEQSGVGPGTIAVKNDTCADYYIRVVAEASPRPPTPPVTTAADAGP
jgi:hypothetical protein